MRIILFSLLSIYGFGAYSQSGVVEKVAKESCACIGEIKVDIKDEKKYKQIKECIGSANMTVQLLSGLGIEKTLDSISNGGEVVDSVLVNGDKEIIIDIDQNYKEIEEYLLRNCEAMKTLMASKDEKNKHSVSRKKKAKKAYDQGQMFFQEGKYAIAIEHYKNAVAIDPKFAFAWDMIGYSYRKLGDYDKAIENYEKSLEIDPKGKMPLINIAYAHEFKGDFDGGIEAMNHYISIYPEEAEGYYGRGRLYHKKQDYRRALDDMMKAYKLYTEVGSPYARDAESNLGLFYRELEGQSNLELFFEMAKKHDIKVD